MFLINLQGKESIYEQIKSQISVFIKRGVLKPGDKLPSVRSLAQELSINPNTVMKAYQELEKNGYIYTLNKKGVFVAKNSIKKRDSAKKDAIAMIQSLKNEGFSKEELSKLVIEVYKEGANVKH